MPQYITTLAIVLRRLFRQRDGSILPIFGVALFALIFAAGMAIDVGRAYSVKVRLGAALDAAALSVGSESGLTAGQMSTYLQNYFTANYPSTALGNNVTVAPVPANANLSAAVVNYQATANVPTLFMRLIGVNSIPVTATAQTSKTIGLEVVLVLDNTGSMLCGPNDGAPNYSDGQCSGGVISSDTTCANSGNESRICTLITASTQFVNTLTNSITSSGQLFIGVVPYVTTVNIGTALCSGASTCTHMATDCASNWTDQYGNPVAPTAINLSSLTVTGTVTNLSTTITAVSPNPSSYAIGTVITGTAIPSGTTITATTANTITMSKKATANHAGETITIDRTISTTNASNVVNVYPNNSGITVGSVFQASSGNSPLQYNTSVSGVSSGAAATQVTLCNNAIATTTGASYTLGTPTTYDTTHTATTQNWMGCVIEPTSSDENSSVSYVPNSTTADPDTTEPSGGWPSWYLYWWPNSTAAWPNGAGSGNTWTSSPSNVKTQSNTTETQGSVVADWDQFGGPNQGCPVPILPLTDVTTTAGKNTVLSTISSMWPRDAGGTQVHIGMIWGWRTISPSSPFTPTSGHPIAYNTSGWKKVVVLMTDGTEEWPADNLTGLGLVEDGKINTTNIANATTNLNTRLQTVCSNMANNGGIIIYTIGLGSDGASNTALQTCPGESGGSFYAATTGNLQNVFQTIANELLALRLSQ